MTRRSDHRSKMFVPSLAVAVVLLVGLMAAAPALADHGGGFEDCLDSEGYYGSPMDCTWDEDGHVISNTNLDGPASGIGGFIVLALLWALVPAGIAASMASARGQSVGLAVVVALALGWLGLAGLYFYWQDRGSAPSTSPEHFPPPQRVVRPTANVAGGAMDPAARLRELKSLLDQGLIEQGEFDSRRQAILNEV